MNISGFARGLMSKNYSTERFLLHVANCVEGQLKEWDEKYEVLVLKLKNYEFIVKMGDQDYYLPLPEEEIAALQQMGAFALDRRVWRELENQGLPIQRGHGNYINYVL
ncbi:hypothetical protein [Neobacillus dielmonensis]|uniref:hypothetical protein n=1 Tax=Neobacillus dielmonensis TaxID=1347369 RepID=UPI000B064A30|nr:hypothetical protein [Neobacillus dielmonensis]